MKVIAENPRYFGKHGFKRPQKVLEEEIAINIGEIDSSADILVERGLAEMKGKRYMIDVTSLGIDKILGSGKVTKKMDLTGVSAITARAREKVTGIGGTIDLPEE
jgi:large subunit ribosomal protein L15